MSDSGGIGCFGLIVLGVLGTVGYFAWDGYAVRELPGDERALLGNSSVEIVDPQALRLKVRNGSGYILREITIRVALSDTASNVVSRFWGECSELRIPARMSDPWACVVALPPDASAALVRLGYPDKATLDRLDAVSRLTLRYGDDHPWKVEWDWISAQGHHPPIYLLKSVVDFFGKWFEPANE